MRVLVFFPTGASEIAAHHALHRERLRLLYDHGASSELLAERLQVFWKLFEIRCHKVIRNVVKTLEPKRRNLVEHCALGSNRIGKDHVESRDAISYDK